MASPRQPLAPSDIIWVGSPSSRAGAPDGLARRCDAASSGIDDARGAARLHRRTPDGQAHPQRPIHGIEHDPGVDATADQSELDPEAEPTPRHHAARRLEALSKLVGDSPVRLRRGDKLPDQPPGGGLEEAHDSAQVNNEVGSDVVSLAEQSRPYGALDKSGEDDRRSRRPPAVDRLLGHPCDLGDVVDGDLSDPLVPTSSNAAASIRWRAPSPRVVGDLCINGLTRTGGFIIADQIGLEPDLQIGEPTA